MKRFVLVLLGMLTLTAQLVCTSPTSAQTTDMQRLNPRMPPPMLIDDQRVSDAGVFVSTGKHINLYSDIDDADQRREWVDLFDAATKQWCNLFNVDYETTKPWKMTAIVMQDETRIRNAGLIPDDLPEFPAGYNRGHEFWVYLQKDDYYTRHLILHEGTHAFMQWFLGSSGPPWYSEGMAEWIALHHWDGKVLKLNQQITDRSQTPGWGRIRLLETMLAKSNPKSLDDILVTPPTAFRDVNAYAWSWAACEFLAHHPTSKQLFAELPTRLNQLSQPISGFSPRLRRKLDADWSDLTRDWYLYIHEADYGTDIEAARLTPASKNADGSFEIAATSSWQSTSIPVKAGESYQITGSGDFIVGQTTKPWRCESNGVTVQYYDGQPLGKLMATVIGDSPEKITRLPVGLSQEPLRFAHDGVLSLRINESPANLGDNGGSLKVTIEKLE